MRSDRGRMIMNSTETPRGMVTEPAYEPPAVEKVLTADELGREIQYAGQPSLTDSEAF